MGRRLLVPPRSVRLEVPKREPQGRADDIHLAASVAAQQGTAVLSLMDGQARVPIFVRGAQSDPPRSRAPVSRQPGEDAIDRAHGEPCRPSARGLFVGWGCRIRSRTWSQIRRVTLGPQR